jgi:hypothetical protein
MVRLSWRYPPNAPESVHIYPVRFRDGGAQLVTGGHITRYLRDCPDGCSFNYDDATGGADVMKRDFCVFLAGHNDLTPDAGALLSSPEYLVTVSIGRARIEYEIRSKSVEWGMRAHRVRLRSSAEIDAGILGYTFDFYGMEMTAPLPGHIHQGKTEYPPLYLPEGAHIALTLANGRNTDISVYPGRVPMFFKSLKRR